MSPGMLVSLWTGRVGMTTLVVLTVLAGRRFTSRAGAILCSRTRNGSR